MSQRSLMLHFIAVSAGLSLLLAGCGDSGASGSAVISAATGGTVTAGTHTINIPPAALGSDLEITVQTGNAGDYPALEGSNGNVLVLLPEGTTLAVPASVTIGAELVNVSSGQIVSIHQYVNVDGIDWTRMSSELGSGGTVSVTISRLAPLGIVVTDAPSGSSIVGTLLWADGTAVGGVQLELWQGESVLTTATTDDNGGFSFADLSEGSYTIMGDLECAVNQGVTVVSGEPTQVNLTLCAG